MTQEDYKKCLENAKNRRNPFQIFKAEEVQKRNNISLQQFKRFNSIKEVGYKPIPHNFEKIKDGSFFR